MDIRKWIGLFFFYLVLYMYIYSPHFAFFPFSTSKFLTLALPIFLLFSKDRRFLKYLKTDTLYLLIILLYLMLFVVPRNLEISTIIYRHIIGFLECFLVPFLLFTLFREKWEKMGLIRPLINVGIIASAISIALIINPEFTFNFRENILIDDIDSDPSLWEIKFLRGFALAESSTFGYGVVQGLLFSLLLLTEKNIWKILFSLALFSISILFNSRVGFSVIGIGFVFFILKHNFKLVKYVAPISIFIFSLTVLFIYFQDFISQFEKSIEWGIGFFKETGNFLFGSGGEDVTTYSTLAEDNIFLPDGFLQVLFGQAVVDVRSDIGYIKTIFIGGFFYLLLLLLFLTNMTLKIRSRVPINYLAIFLFLTLLVVNFKGPALFFSSSFFKVFGLCYAYGIVNVLRCKDNKDNLNIASS